MRAVRHLFVCLLGILGLCGQAWSATPTDTASPTLSPTVTISPTATRSSTPTTTATNTRSITPTRSWTPTITHTATVSPTGTMTPISDPLIEDFPGGVSFPSSRAGWYGTLSIQAVAGPACGSSAFAARLAGSSPQYNGVDLLYTGPYAVPVPTPINYSQVAGQTRALSFRLKANTLYNNTLQVQVHTFSGAYAAMVGVTPGAWVNVTVAAPDHAAPGSWPQLVNISSPDAWAQHVEKVTRIEFAPQADILGIQPYDFEIDDLRWGVYPAVNSCQASTAFGVPVATVDEAYGAGLDDNGAWVLVVLSRHCGLTPNQVLAQRATKSWGQIAADCGSTWTAILAEVDSLADAAGLVPETGGPGNWEPLLTNGPPVLGPLPTPTPYAVPGPVALPTPGVCP